VEELLLLVVGDDGLDVLVFLGETVGGGLELLL
jgi:hypothetical protein